MCKGKPAQPESQVPSEKVEYVETEDSTDCDDEQVAFAIHTVIKESASRIMLELIVNGVRMPMQLDTGASISIVSQATMKKLLPHAS